MTALLRAELLKLRTTRTFAAVVASAAALSLTLVVLGAALGKETKAHALFTNSAITYIIVILGAIAMTGEWRHRTITGSVLAAPNRVRLLAAKAISYSVAGIALAIIVTVPTIIVGELVLSGRGLATLGAGGIADVLWRNLAVAALLGPLGVCVGALIRNQIVTVVGLIIIAAAIEPAVFQASRKSVASSRSPALPEASSAAPTGTCRPRPRSRSWSPGHSPSSRQPPGACVAATSSDANIPTNDQQTTQRPPPSTRAQAGAADRASRQLQPRLAGCYLQRKARSSEEP